MAQTAISSTQTTQSGVIGFSEQDLVEHVLSRLAWVSREDFLDHVSTHCVDGRGGYAVVGAPGGDAGEFLLALGAVELMMKHEIPDAAVKSLFGDYMKFHGHFYMHTDAHMLEALAHDIEQDAELSVLVKGLSHEQVVNELENVIRMPPMKIRAKLLDRLVGVVKLGCGHLTLMRQHQDEFGVRPELVNAFLRVFYQALWNGEHVEWDVLRGDHAEQAVVNIIAETGEAVPSQLPLVAPYCHGEQVFVNHPQAEELMLDKSFKFVEDHFGALYPIEKTRYMQIAKEMVGRHTMTTLKYLAKGLPLYEAHVTPEGDCSVSLVGTV